MIRSACMALFEGGGGGGKGGVKEGEKVFKKIVLK